MRSHGIVACWMVAGACSSTKQPDRIATREECVATRDHTTELMVAHAIAHPEETWDGLETADPARDLSLGLTRATFGAFLHSDRAKGWLAARRMAVTITPGMSEWVEKCRNRARKANIDCWLAATSMEAFQTCPIPR